MFVHLTAKSGTPITMNLDHVVEIRPNISEATGEECGSILYSHSHAQYVKEKYMDIIKMLEGKE